VRRLKGLPSILLVMPTTTEIVPIPWAFGRSKDQATVLKNFGKQCQWLKFAMPITVKHEVVIGIVVMDWYAHAMSVCEPDVETR
jgi:hypothetical protein